MHLSSSCQSSPHLDGHSKNMLHRAAYLYIIIGCHMPRAWYGESGYIMHELVYCYSGRYHCVLRSKFCEVCTTPVEIKRMVHIFFQFLLKSQLFKEAPQNWSIKSCSTPRGLTTMGRQYPQEKPKKKLWEGKRTEQKHIANGLEIYNRPELATPKTFVK